MSFVTWAEYALYVFLFMVTPGPSHLLMIANSIGSGFNRSYACAAGDLSANTIQILIAGFGIGLIAFYGTFILALKIAGVAYLLYSGAKMLYDGAQTKPKEEARKGKGTLYFQGFVTSIVNPKAIIFFTALFPQFIAVDQAIGAQLLVLGLTYIVIDGSFLLFYGLTASAAARKMGEHSAIVKFVPGVVMVITSIILAARIASLDLGW